MGFPRKKLLVLDVNGLLVDTYHRNEPRPTKELPNAKVGNFYVYKRPCCDEFLQFCLENFVVGIWSSAREYNVNNLVEYIFGKLREKLAFSWHQSDCTDSGLRAPENKHKPLFLKELSKLWVKAKPDLPWNEGEYGPTNTLLVDDTPYKALRNPPNTGIFPSSYTVSNSGDDFLGSGLRNYLKGICDTTNVQIFVENNPLGQPSIDSTSPYWSYLSQIFLTVNSVASEVGDGIGKALDNFKIADTELANDSNKYHVPDGTKLSHPIITCKISGEIADVASPNIDHLINDGGNTFHKGSLEPVNQEICVKHASLGKTICSSSEEPKRSCSVIKVDGLEDCEQIHEDNENRERHINDEDACSAKEPVPDDTNIFEPHGARKSIQEVCDVTSQKGHSSRGMLQHVDHVKLPLNYGVGYCQPKRKRNSAINHQEINGKLDSSSSSYKRHNNSFQRSRIDEIDNCKQMHEEEHDGVEHIGVSTSSERVESHWQFSRDIEREFKCSRAKSNERLQVWQSRINGVENCRQMYKEDHDRAEHIGVVASSERVEGRCSTHWQFSRSIEREYGCRHAKSNERLHVTRMSGHFEEHSFPNTHRSGWEQQSRMKKGQGFFREKYDKESCNENRSRQTFKEDKAIEQFDVERCAFVSRERVVGFQCRGQSDVWERIGEQANVGYAHTTVDNSHIRGSRISHVQRDHPNGYLPENRIHNHSVGNEVNDLISDESYHHQGEEYRHTQRSWGNKRHQGSNFVDMGMHNEGMDDQLTQGRGLLSSHKFHTVAHFARSDYELHSNLGEHHLGRWNKQTGFFNRRRTEICGDDGSIDQESGASSQFFGSQRNWDHGYGQQTNHRHKDPKKRLRRQRWSVQ